jgi:hypothetical protein
VPDADGKMAAWGECMIDLTANKTSLRKGFQPLSTMGQTIYGTVDGNLVVTTPGGKSYPLPKETARPWGIAGTHAIVVHNSVLYALDKK